MTYDIYQDLFPDRNKVYGDSSSEDLLLGLLSSLGPSVQSQPRQSQPAAGGFPGASPIGASGVMAVPPNVSPNDPGGLSAFMQAIKDRESSGGNYNWNYTSPQGAHGAYQFMPGTWAGWVNEMKAQGENVNVNDTSQANQDRVAKHAMTQLFNKYHDWGKVAQAWLGGEGSVGKNVSDALGTTTSGYARDVLNDMAKRLQSMPRNEVATPQTDIRARMDSIANQLGPLQQAASTTPGVQAQANASIQRANDLLAKSRAQGTPGASPSSGVAKVPVIHENPLERAFKALTGQSKKRPVSTPTPSEPHTTRSVLY